MNRRSLLLAVPALVLARRCARAQVISIPFSPKVIGLGAGMGSSVTGTATETNLAAVKVPANTLGANGRLRVEVFFTYPSSANNKNLIIRFNTTSGAVTGGTIYLNQTSTTTTSFRAVILIQNQNSTSSQEGAPNTVTSGTSSGAVITSALDTTADTYININGIPAGSGETIALVSYSVEAIVP